LAEVAEEQVRAAICGAVRGPGEGGGKGHEPVQIQQSKNEISPVVQVTGHRQPQQ
jgi:hypothetical protein